MRLITLEGGLDRNLCYLAAAEAAAEAVLVDAAVEAEAILQALARERLQLELLVLTHAHHDHWIAAAEVLARTGAALAAFGESGPRLGLASGRYRALRDGEEFRAGGLLWRALHTPGHEPHHICLYLPEEHALFTGDVLFIGRTGRTVAPGADTRQLYRSLRSRVLVLPDRTRLYPGHDYGPVRSRTLGEERAVNPWLQAEDEQAFVRVMQEYERRRRG